MLRLLTLIRRRNSPVRLRSSAARPAPPPIPLPLSQPRSLPPPPPRRAPPLLLLISGGALLSALAFSPIDHRPESLDELLHRSRDSLTRVLGSMRQTGAAAAVLWRSLASVLTSANHEVQRGFELRVAALVADIAAANEGRRAAIVGAGRGMVVDWLLETVAVGESGGTQAESARALSYLLSDPSTCGAVMGRPGAVPSLLRFIFSFQPKRGKKSSINTVLLMVQAA